MSEATLRWQAQRIQELEAQLAELTRAPRRDDETMMRLRVALRLSPQQAQILARLHRGPVTGVSHGQLQAMLNNAEAVTDIVKTTIFQLRRRLGRDVIGTVHGFGYRLTDTGRGVVNAALQRFAGRTA